MNKISETPDYQAMLDSLDRLPKDGILRVVNALFRALIMLLAAIRSGAGQLPSPPETCDPARDVPATAVSPIPGTTDEPPFRDVSHKRRRASRGCVRAPAQGSAGPTVEVAAGLNAPDVSRSWHGDVPVGALVDPSRMWQGRGEVWHRCFRGGPAVPGIGAFISLRFHNVLKE